MNRKEALSFIKSLVALRKSATDPQALDAPAVYPQWKAGASYQVGDRVLYENTLYKVLQSHNSEQDWTPVVSPSLFAKVLIPDENVIPNWEQPDSTNPYMTGDKVIYNDIIWISTIDNNVWEPGVYGWDKA